MTLFARDILPKLFQRGIIDVWTLKPLEEYDKRRKKWPKKYKRESIAVHNNLDTFLKALCRGQKPKDAKFGFIHPEPGGVLAIDQKGGGQSMKETRLYIYPDEESECVFVITLGDKDSQTEDIQTCRDFVKSFRATSIPQHPSREEPHVQE
jgi:hypothetical protein